MKTYILLLLFYVSSVTAFAQKADYKNGLISVDGKDVAKVVKIKDKENFGLTSTFELYSMSGEKLIIATISTEFAADRNDNSYYYYRFTFLTAGKEAIFAVGKLTAEKSFARLIGESGIVVNDKIDEAKLSEFIALKSRSPKTIVEYKLVSSNRMLVVLLRNGQVFQGSTLIGEFKDVSNRADIDSYEFRLVDGPVVARVRFTGGNSAKNCIIITQKDNASHNVSLENGETYGRITAASPGVDRNTFALQKIASWLVVNNYL